MERIDNLINEISNMQLTDGNAYYNRGMFPSQRSHSFFKYNREDDNIYYSALIAFTLQSLIEHVNNVQSKQLQKIIEGIIANYNLYLSTKNPSLYNFYQTNPSKHYPNGNFLSKFNHFKLADDADVTVILSMTINSVTKTRINEIRAQLINFSNLYHKKIKNSLAKYKNLPAYGVWFGSGRMPIEFDLCVMTNILCFIFKYNCELNECDLASLKYIKMAIIEEDIEYRPFSVSYIYPNTTIILYHIARLCSMMKNSDKYLPTKKIVSILQDNLSKSKKIIERIMLSSSLIKMNVKTSEVKYKMEDLKREFNNFSFFVAPMLAGTGNPILNYLAKSKIFHLLFVCNSYYLSLVLEYEVLSKLHPEKNKL